MTAMKSGSRFYDAGLDLLRFFAFLMVFGFHSHKNNVSHALAGFFKIGKFGVGVFFVLSAYLITELLLRESEKTGTVSLPKFYLRRVLRIWPLYFLVLAIGVLFGLVSPNHHIGLLQAAAFSLLLGNVYAAHYGVGAAIIYPLWTLSIEEQFYAVVPAVMKRGGWRALGVISIVLVAIAYVALLFLGTREHVFLQNQLANYNSFVQFQFFAAGTLLAIYLHRRTWKPHYLVRITLFLGALAAMAVCVGRLMLESPEPRTPGALIVGYILRLLSTLALFLAFLNIDIEHLGPFRRLTYLGRISYGLYLYHALILVLFFGGRNPFFSFFDKHFWIGDALALLVTTLVASFSFRYFEQPILRLKSRYEVIKTGLPAPG